MLGVSGEMITGTCLTLVSGEVATAGLLAPERWSYILKLPALAQAQFPKDVFSRRVRHIPLSPRHDQECGLGLPVVASSLSC